ncbi:MAG: AAA family ATPase, partial [Spartobacteria bacterium]
MSATLASLRIRNLALVENLLWEPPSGFVAITGETGAGKSIILGAVKLLLGERAEKSLVRSGADACAVEGLFQIPADSRVHATLEEGGAEACEDGALVIKRTVSTAGAGKQFVNGSPCTLALLRQLGDLLVDLHGPHDHQSLFSRDQQMLVLDSFAGAEALRTGYGARRREWMQLTAEKKRLTENAEALARELDLLTHQVAEIDEAALQPGEEDQLLARQRTGANAHRLCSICADHRLSLGIQALQFPHQTRHIPPARCERVLGLREQAGEVGANRAEAVGVRARALACAELSFLAWLQRGCVDLGDRMRQ